MTNGQALNAYAYVYNDPLNLVDPAGYFGIGDAVVWTAQHAPESWRPGIQNAAAKGINGLDWWYSKPDNCDCGSSNFPAQKVSLITQFGFAMWTKPAQRIASRVGLYQNAAPPAGWQQITRGMETQRLYQTYKYVDVTDMRLRLDYSSMETLTSVETGKSSYLLRMRDGRQVYVKDVVDRATTDLKGVFASGLIEGGIQWWRDKGLCLSPNQRFWRAYMAGLFGLVGGLLGTAAVMLAVSFRAPAIVAGLAGFVIGTIVGQALNSTKSNWLNRATVIAGRM